MMNMRRQAPTAGDKQWLVALFSLAMLVMAAPWGAMAGEPTIQASPENQYVGAKKCKSCHEAAESGAQYVKWTEAKHSHAMEVLSTPEAKEVGAKQGIADPATSEKCLSCHVTGYGEPKTHFADSFKPSAGVGCESCHGPGQAHAKARLAAADSGSAADDFGFGEPAAETGPVKLPAGEIIHDSGKKRCLECHNENSPSYKPFDFDEFHEKIAHTDPRKAK